MEVPLLFVWSMLDMPVGSVGRHMQTLTSFAHGHKSTCVFLPHLSVHRCTFVGNVCLVLDLLFCFGTDVCT